jgi:hypothetical protein
MDIKANPAFINTLGYTKEILSSPIILIYTSRRYRKSITELAVLSNGVTNKF